MIIKSKSAGKLIQIIAAAFTAIFCMNVAAVNNPVSYDSDITNCDVLKYNGEYYIQGSWLQGDMLRSRDMESWGERRHVFSWNNSWHTQQDPRGADYDIHAGHIRYINGTFHYYTQLGDYITHATSDTIWGPYIESVDSVFAGRIDAETFLDDDGQLYFYSTRFTGGNQNYVHTMSDPWTLTGNYIYQISGNGGWEGTTTINEGPKVIKYRGRYYMLYNAYHTEDPNYSIGCVEASSPTGFSNSGKYPAAVCKRIVPALGKPEINTVGQPWVADGLNGFEKWFGYFANTTAEGRTQRIDRMHFFDRTLFIDGPTDRYTSGYHPGPAKPQLLSIFPVSDGPMVALDWTEQIAGTWAVVNEEAVQSDQSKRAYSTVNRDAAINYLFEANLRFTQAQDSEDKAGVIAYYEDINNYVIAGLNRVTDTWSVHVKEAGVDTAYSGSYGGSVDYSVYHKIRVVKNGGKFDIRIDDMIPPNHSTISSSFTGAGLPGLFTDHAAAAFDGIIYTIGWDEYDNGIVGWGDLLSGVAQVGTWTVGSSGISSTGGYTFKGDLMAEYEFSTQVYKTGADGLIGVLPVAVDLNNYMLAYINTATDQFTVSAVKDGVALAAQNVAVGNADNYNIRTVKLADKLIFFIDGVEVMEYTVSYGPAQVGLYAGVPARFNGIMTYRTEPVADIVPWVTTDIGAVGFPGITDFLDDTLYLTGSGSDIWDLNDEFTFTHIDDTGDFEISARVVNLDETHSWAKAGFMFRNDLADNSGMFMLLAAPGSEGLGRAQMLYRNASGLGTSTLTAPSDLPYPIWLKLNRQGDTFTGYYSSDGQTWTLIGSRNVQLNTSGKLGFGVSAHNNDRITTTVIDRIGLTL